MPTIQQSIQSAALRSVTTIIGTLLLTRDFYKAAMAATAVGLGAVTIDCAYYTVNTQLTRYFPTFQANQYIKNSTPTTTTEIARKVATEWSLSALIGCTLLGTNDEDTASFLVSSAVSGATTAAATYQVVKFVKTMSLT